MDSDSRVQRMFYRPQRAECAHLWDVWLQIHENRYYLYFLGGPGVTWDNISLAVSDDGVSWVEHGVVVRLSPGARAMGSAGVWASHGATGLPPFVMNLREYRPDRGIVMFALGSQNLIDWERLGEEYTFGPDERWYEPEDRWVGIDTIPRPEGGYYGYWTGTPKQGVDGLFGFGRSRDGASWEVLPPPEVEGMGRGILREVGGAAIIGGKVYLLMCVYQSEMTVLVGDRPEGPFRIQEKNARLLFGQTHFARFAGGPSDGPLVVHHVMTTTGLDTAPVSYFAPIKRALLDDDGTLRLAYWEGNDRLKTLPVEIGPPRVVTERLVMLAPQFDIDRGLILEGRLSNLSAGGFLALKQGLYIEFAEGQGTAVMISPSGLHQLGVMHTSPMRFRMDSFIARQRPWSADPRFRLLLRHSLLEFYLDDYLIQCYSLPAQATGRIGIIHNGNREGISDLRAWN